MVLQSIYYTIWDLIAFSLNLSLNTNCLFSTINSGLFFIQMHTNGVTIWMGLVAILQSNLN